MTNQSNLPIGVFDSGVGGLTVLKALMQTLPNESFIYLGDTARLPYGTKSQDTVIHYSRKVCDTLIKQGIKMLIVACNTASSLALDTLKLHYPQLPMIGVVEPSAYACAQQTKNNCVVVIGTEATIKGQVYQRMIAQYNPRAQILTRACNLFVAMAEEGLIEGEIAEKIIANYLLNLINDPAKPDTLVLGCTHFPLLTHAIRKVIGENIHIIDSASVTAIAVKQLLNEFRLTNTEKSVTSTRFLVTDSPQRFGEMGKLFLQQQIDVSDIDLVDR